MLFRKDLSADLLALGEAGEKEVLGGQAPQPVEDADVHRSAYVMILLHHLGLDRRLVEPIVDLFVALDIGNIHMLRSRYRQGLEVLGPEDSTQPQPPEVTVGVHHNAGKPYTSFARRTDADDAAPAHTWFAIAQNYACGLGIHTPDGCGILDPDLLVVYGDVRGPLGSPFYDHRLVAGEAESQREPAPGIGLAQVSRQGGLECGRGLGGHGKDAIQGADGEDYRSLRRERIRPGRTLLLQQPDSYACPAHPALEELLPLLDPGLLAGEIYVENLSQHFQSPSTGISSISRTPWGQNSAHAPQWMHFTGIFSLPKAMAPTRQAFSQLPQPVQRSL